MSTASMGFVKATMLPATLGLSIAMASSAMAEGNPRVNQVGYVTQAEKVAVYANNSSSPLSWQLVQHGSTIAQGQTVPKGFDQSSGETLHHIDFSQIQTQGDGYQLIVGADQSYSFDIRSDIYTGISYDALKYFYHNRSGIEIKAEHTGGGLGTYANDAKWARPAGHLGQGANKGDFNVACWPGTCNYSLDVPYGWYDAGDHGKYVVNGGISVWKLANAYEAAKHLRGTDARFADGTLNIPESSNGVADILDEIKWQMRFMMSMQVPEGQALAGMAHHKMHDFGWTGIPTLPHEDSNDRYLAPPTTAATYNLAATAAMCGRLFSDSDPAFASQCLSVAERAWDAAQNHPNEIIAPGQFNNGGGEYGDPKLWADKIWAAAELYITTGNSAKYRASADLNQIVSPDYNWQKTDVAGLISLATVDSDNSADLRSAAQQKIIAFANDRLGTANSEGYRTSLTTEEYAWGSNNNMANILNVLAIAYDLTQDERYASAVGSGLNYLFGTNPLARSYITGHGDFASAQPHHRHWAGVKDGSLPWAPPGAFIGGPNHGLEDDLSRGALDGCQTHPMTCYIDDIGAWSTNEITINWNSALVQITAFFDDYATGGAKAPTVSLTQPLNGLQLETGANLEMAADASDADGNVVAVRFFLDGVLVATDTTAPFSASVSGLSDSLYQVTAQAEDNDGLTSDSASATVRIGEVPNQPPVADFSWQTDNLTVNLNAGNSTDIDGSIVTYSWTLGDGNVLAGETVTHTYSAADTYSVQLTVEDNDGAFDILTQNVTVSDQPDNPFSCTVSSYDIWNNGAIVRDVVVTNDSADTQNGWSIELTANVGVSIIDVWGASAVANGVTVEASGNDSLAPGSSVQFTMQIGHGGGFSGMTCDSGKKEPGDFSVQIEAESFTDMQGVQTESTTDIGGGLNVGWIDAGDWMIFPTVNLPKSGQYLVEYRVASLGGAGVLQFEEGGGSPVYEQKNVPNTLGWQSWTTISSTLTLSAGTHNFAIAAPAGGFNLNWIKITEVQ